MDVRHKGLENEGNLEGSRSKAWRAECGGGGHVSHSGDPPPRPDMSASEQKDAREAV